MEQSIHNAVLTAQRKTKHIWDAETQYILICHVFKNLHLLAVQQNEYL